jgi:predicted dienelactone hydrolase
MGMLDKIVKPSLIGLLILGLIACKTQDPPPLTPSPTQLDEPGTYTLAKLNTRLQNDYGGYPSTVYYPAQGGGPFPAITFSPGLASNKALNRWVGDHLATHGYVVLIFTVPNPLLLRTHQQQAGFELGFDYLEQQNADPASPLYGMVDTETRAIMGHSLGAMASLRAAATLDVDAVVPLAPYEIELEYLTAVTAPTQIHAATQDCITPAENALYDYEMLGSQIKQLITINGGNHVSFNDAGSVAEIIGGALFDCNAVIDTFNHHQRLSRRYFTAWLEYLLKGQTQYEPYLFGALAQQDLASELLTELRFELP